jgi:thiol:disulfide interchange protein DsbD
MRYILILTLFFYSLMGMGSFLMPDEAFKPRAEINDGKVRVTIDLDPSVFLYKEKLHLSLDSSAIALGAVELSQGEMHDGHEVYRGSVVLEAPLLGSAKAADAVTAVVAYQGCSDMGLCYEPLEKAFTLKVDGAELAAEPKVTPPAELSETDTIAATFQSGSIALILLTFFGFGLLLALTPCVFPMIPILSSIIVSQGEGMNAKRGFLLSLIYVLSMSIAYTSAGVLAGLFGSNIQASMQNPWVLSVFAGVFVVLAISMFGFFEIGLPASLQSRLSRSSDKAGQKGGFVGVGVMGFLSALIVGPCVAPPLAGALVYIGQTGDALLGGIALFVMSLGMGMPLLLIGVGAGRFMPKPGGWMSSVSKVFGVIMLAIAIWMLSRILPGEVIMLLWALLFIVSSVYLGTFETLPPERKSWNALFKGFGIVLFIVGGSLLLGIISGSNNPLDPLEKFASKTAQNFTAPDEKAFVKVSSLSDLEAVLQQNRGKKVMLDFYAEWCTACKELEHTTFADRAVRAALSEFVLVQADVTANTEDVKRLSKKFGIFGPPAIVFFDENGRNLDAKKLIGYKAPETFLKHLRRL